MEEAQSPPTASGEGEEKRTKPLESMGEHMFQLNSDLFMTNEGPISCILDGASELSGRGTLWIWRTPMKMPGKVIAWTCVCSTLFMGCYNLAMVDPKGDDREKINPDDVKFVVTNDGQTHMFDSPPTITDSVVIGVSNNKPLSIPLSEVRRVGVRKSAVGPLLYTLVGIGCLVGLVVVVESMPNFQRTSPTGSGK